MLPISQIVMDLSTTILAILIGIVAYRKLPVFYRILFFQALAYLVVDSYASTYQNNGFTFSLGIIIEIGLVFLAAAVYFNTIKSRLVVSSLFLIFLLCFILDIYLLGSKHFTRHAYIIGGILITGTYLTILSFHFFERKDKYHTSALVLTCVGIVLYFAGIEPYLSMITHIRTPQSNTNFFNLIIVNLGHLRYFLLALSFLILAQPFRFNLLKKVS